MVEFTIRNGNLVSYSGTAEVVKIPNGVKAVGDYVFSGCTRLKKMVVPDSVEQIFNNAFENCTGLETVTIGNSIKGLGSKIFNGCTSLKSVTMKKVPSMYDDDLYTANPNTTVYYRIA